MVNRNSLSQFCLDHRLPARRILRLIDSALLTEVDRKKRPAWKLDRSEDLGIIISKAAGSARLQYSVCNTDLLITWIRAQLGPELLTPKEIQTIARAARAYHDHVLDQTEFVLMKRQTGDQFRPNPEYFSPLNSLLTRIGV